MARRPMREACNTISAAAESPGSKKSPTRNSTRRPSGCTKSPGAAVLRAAAAEDVVDRLIAFVASVFKDAVIRIASQRNRYSPRFEILLRIVNRHLVKNRIPIHAPKPLDYVQRWALRNPLDAASGGAGRDPAFAIVIGRVHDQRVAFPMTARISFPLPDGGGDVRPAVQRNDAGVVDHLGENDDVSRHLHNLISIVVAGRKHGPRHAARDAAVPRTHIFVRVRIMSQVV